MQAFICHLHTGAVLPGTSSPAAMPSGYRRDAISVGGGRFGRSCHRLYNVFEDVLPRKYAQVFDIKRVLLDAGAMASSMTVVVLPYLVFSMTAAVRILHGRGSVPCSPQTYICTPVEKWFKTRKYRPYWRQIPVRTVFFMKMQNKLLISVVAGMLAMLLYTTPRLVGSVVLPHYPPAYIRFPGRRYRWLMALEADGVVIRLKSWTCFFPYWDWMFQRIKQVAAYSHNQ